MSKRFEVQYITYLSSIVSENGMRILFEKDRVWSNLSSWNMILQGRAI